MPSQTLSLMEGSLIRYRDNNGATKEGSLPDVYAALMRDEVLAFNALRPHQRHAWHAFLVQLGAIAMHSAGLRDAPCDPSEWRRIIRGLTPDFPGDEPWYLVVDDITKPAFIQPPASSGERAADYKNSVATPDELDVLVTSKNHDVKAAVAEMAETDDWIFALITLQTFEGFLGAGNYGISRMNGGLGCRPAFSITPSTSPGAHVRRDILALMEHRDELLYDHDPFLMEDGLELLWLKPWDGTKPEALSGGLGPFYVEVCRRVRLRPSPSGRLHAVRATSKAARVNSKPMKGVTGDPWTPINRKENKSLTLSGAGFSYRRTSDYLSTDWNRPVLLKPTAEEADEPGTMKLVARGMVRGQGKTEGYHEKTVPLEDKVVRTFGNTSGMEELGNISRERIEDVSKVQGILRHAVAVFSAGGVVTDIAKEHRARANAWSKMHDEVVDGKFFADLQREFGLDNPDKRRQERKEWQERIIDEARALLRDAQDSLPCPAIWRYRARVRADSVFEMSVRGRNGFPELYSGEGGD